MRGEVHHPTPSVILPIRTSDWVASNLLKAHPGVFTASQVFNSLCGRLPIQAFRGKCTQNINLTSSSSNRLTLRNREVYFIQAFSFRRMRKQNWTVTKHNPRPHLSPWLSQFTPPHSLIPRRKHS